jgi:hypothetical protein
MSQYGPPERDAGDIDALIAGLEMEYTQVCEFTWAAPAPVENRTGDGGHDGPTLVTAAR